MPDELVDAHTKNKFEDLHEVIKAHQIKIKEDTSDFFAKIKEVHVESLSVLDRTTNVEKQFKMCFDTV